MTILHPVDCGVEEMLTIIFSEDISNPGNFAQGYHVRRKVIKSPGVGKSLAVELQKHGISQHSVHFIFNGDCMLTKKEPGSQWILE